MIDRDAADYRADFASSLPDGKRPTCKACEAPMVVRRDPPRDWKVAWHCPRSDEHLAVTPVEPIDQHKFFAWLDRELGPKQPGQPA